MRPVVAATAALAGLAAGCGELAMNTLTAETPKLEAVVTLEAAPDRLRFAIQRYSASLVSDEGTSDFFAGVDWYASTTGAYGEYGVIYRHDPLLFRRDGPSFVMILPPGYDPRTTTFRAAIVRQDVNGKERVEAFSTAATLTEAATSR